MITADDDGSFHPAVGDHAIEQQAGLVAFAESEPADARGQALEGHAFAGHLQPAVQAFILGK